MALLRRRRATLLWPHIAIKAASKYLFSGSGFASAVVSCWLAIRFNSCCRGSRHASRNLRSGSLSDILFTLSLASSILPSRMRMSGLALARRCLQHPGIAENITQGEMSLGALRLPLDQRIRVAEGLGQLASFCAVYNQPDNRTNEVRIESHCSFQGRVGALTHRFAAGRIARVIVITRA